MEMFFTIYVWSSVGIIGVYDTTFKKKNTSIYRGV